LKLVSIQYRNVCQTTNIHAIIKSDLFPSLSKKKNIRHLINDRVPNFQDGKLSVNGSLR
jgi:hypothetical protein